MITDCCETKIFGRASIADGAEFNNIAIFIGVDFNNKYEIDEQLTLERDGISK